MCVYFYVLAVGLICVVVRGRACACVCELVHACARAAAGPAFELSLTWAERGRAAGRGGDGKAGGGGCPTNSPSSLSPFHLPPPASNNKPFNSAIFAGSHPRTLEAPTRSRCLIQCSEKNSWLESDFFLILVLSFPPPPSLPKNRAVPHPVLAFIFYFFPPLPLASKPLLSSEARTNETRENKIRGSRFWNSQGAIKAPALMMMEKKKFSSTYLNLLQFYTVT